LRGAGLQAAGAAENRSTAGSDACSSGGGRENGEVAQVLVIADDLIGAAATAARFARAGQRVTMVAPEQVARVAEDHDVIVANLDSRHMPPHQATDLVADVVEAVWPVGLVI